MASGTLKVQIRVMVIDWVAFRIDADFDVAVGVVAVNETFKFVLWSAVNVQRDT